MILAEFAAIDNTGRPLRVGCRGVEPVMAHRLQGTLREDKVAHEF